MNIFLDSCGVTDDELRRTMLGFAEKPQRAGVSLSIAKLIAHILGKANVFPSYCLHALVYQCWLLLSDRRFVVLKSVPKRIPLLMLHTNATATFCRVFDLVKSLNIACCCPIRSIKRIDFFDADLFHHICSLLRSGHSSDVGKMIGGSFPSLQNWCVTHLDNLSGRIGQAPVPKQVEIKEETKPLPASAAAPSEGTDKKQEVILTETPAATIPATNSLDAKALPDQRGPKAIQPEPNQKSSKSKKGKEQKTFTKKLAEAEKERDRLKKELEGEKEKNKKLKKELEDEKNKPRIPPEEKDRLEKELKDEKDKNEKLNKKLEDEKKRFEKELAKEAAENERLRKELEKEKNKKKEEPPKEEPTHGKANPPAMSKKKQVSQKGGGKKEQKSVSPPSERIQPAERTLKQEKSEETAVSKACPEHHSIPDSPETDESTARKKLTIIRTSQMPAPPTTEKEPQKAGEREVERVVSTSSGTTDGTEQPLKQEKSEEANNTETSPQPSHGQESPVTTAAANGGAPSSSKKKKRKNRKKKPAKDAPATEN